MAQWIPIEDRPEDEQRDWEQAWEAAHMKGTSSLSDTWGLERDAAVRQSGRDTLAFYAEQGIGLDRLADSSEPSVRELAHENGWEAPGAPYADESMQPSAERFDAMSHAGVEVTADSSLLRNRFESLDVEGQVDMLAKLSDIYSAAATHTGAAYADQLAIETEKVFQDTGTTFGMREFVGGRCDTVAAHKAELSGLGDFIAEKAKEISAELGASEPSL